MNLLYVLSYLTIAVFILAIAKRFIKFAAMPAHLRWELYPVAHEGKKSVYGGSYFEDTDWWKEKLQQNKLNELTVMLPEIFLLQGIWEHNRKMWLWSFLMHHGVYWCAGMAGLSILYITLQFAGWGYSGVSSFVDLFIAVTGTIGLAAGTIGTLGMLGLRFFDAKMGRFNSFATYFNLFFLLAIFGIGFINLIAGVDIFRQTVGFFGALLGIGFSGYTPGVILFLTLAILFVLYLPFTHMTHFFTKYFTYHSVRWNDEPNLPGGKLEKHIGEYLQYKPTWSAKHIGADGKKNWAEVATSEVLKNDKK